jgi:hypothetical protein
MMRMDKLRIRIQIDDGKYCATKQKEFVDGELTDETNTVNDPSQGFLYTDEHAKYVDAMELAALLDEAYDIIAGEMID